jgi:hypothetical protein
MSVPATFYSTNTAVLLLNTTSVSGTIVLPKTLSTINRVLTFKDRVGKASISTLTLQCTAGDTFENGTSNYVFNQLYGEVTFLAGADQKWYNIGGTQTVQAAVSSMYISSVTGSGALLTNIVNDSNVNSTVSGLWSTNYIRLDDLTSTMTAISTAGGGVLTPNLTSTVTGLTTASYISSTQLQSTVTGISTFMDTFVASVELTSTVTGLNTATYISTATYQTTLRSSVAGLGTAGFVSTLTNQTFTTMNITGDSRISTLSDYSLSTNAIYDSTLQTNDLVLVTPTYTTTFAVQNNSTLLVNGSNFLSNYVPTALIHSTASGISYVSSAALTSSVAGVLQNISTNYFDITELTSTITGLRTAGYLSTIISTSVSTLNVSSTAITSTATTNTLSTSLYLASTFRLNKYIQVSTPSTYVIEVLNSSTLLINNSSLFNNYVISSALVSTTSGLSFISSTALQSTVAGLREYTSSMVDTTEMASTVVGLGTAMYISTSKLDTNLASTVTGLGTSDYVSSLSFLSTFSTFLHSPLSTVNFYYQSTIAIDSYVSNTVASYGSNFLNGSTIFSEVPTLKGSPLITLDQFVSTVSSLFGQPVVQHSQVYSF